MCNLNIGILLLVDQVTTLINSYIEQFCEVDVYAIISSLVSIVLNHDDEAIELFSQMLRVRALLLPYMLYWFLAGLLPNMRY